MPAEVYGALMLVGVVIAFVSIGMLKTAGPVPGLFGLAIAAVLFFTGNANFKNAYARDGVLDGVERATEAQLKARLGEVIHVRTLRRRQKLLEAQNMTVNVVCGEVRIAQAPYQRFIGFGPEEPVVLKNDFNDPAEFDRTWRFACRG